MKAPQERATKKRVDRDGGHPTLVLDGDDNGVYLYEAGEDKWPPHLMSRDEVELVRDYLDAWLDHDAEQVDG